METHKWTLHNVKDGRQYTIGKRKFIANAKFIGKSFHFVMITPLKKRVMINDQIIKFTRPLWAKDKLTIGTQQFELKFEKLQN